MSLKRALATAGPTRPDVSWTRSNVLAHRVAEISRVVGDRTSRTPEPFELDSTLKEVRSAWESRGSLNGLGKRQRRYLPYVLFYPPGNQQDWVGADPTFVKAFLDELKENPRALSSTAFVVLRDYPRALAAFDRLRSRYGTVLVNDESLRTAEWRRRQQAYQLFAPDGPEFLARQLCEGTMPVPELLADAGLVNELGTGAFMRHVHTRALAMLRDMLRARPGREHLERPLAVLQDGAGLRFEDLGGDVGSALLLPHAEQDPLPDTKDRLSSFILTHLKDPRIQPRKWQAVEEGARAVFLRWLVGATLEDFFRLIEKHAFMQHWEYREAFWKAYLRAGVIDDACVVLGEEARFLAKHVFKHQGLVYSRLSGGQRNHSVLLLRVRNLTIAEWSHTGKCRVWTSEDECCPRLHRLDYKRDDLVAAPDYEQVHYGSPNYTWQWELAHFIKRETGVTMHQADYRV